MSLDGTSFQPHSIAVRTLRYALPFAIGVVILFTAFAELSRYVSAMDEHVLAVVAILAALTVGSMFVFFGVFGALAEVIHGNDNS